MLLVNPTTVSGGIKWMRTFVGDLNSAIELDIEPKPVPYVSKQKRPKTDLEKLAQSFGDLEQQPSSEPNLSVLKEESLDEEQPMDVAGGREPCPSSSTPATTIITPSMLGTLRAQGEGTTRSDTALNLVLYTSDLTSQVLEPCLTISNDSNGSADGIPVGSTCRVYNQEQQEI